ncbi:MAG: GntR family transcriptional regulator, partial [Chloroflexota bacterium]|nr:GntR family transcriptional regulator [Chloroflexota bacterium]
MTSIAGLSIDVASGEPIHVQIEEQIKLAVARGRLTPGQRLPPVRTLARDLGVHVNTVAKAVASLSQQGVLETRRGRGTFVAQAGSPRLREEQEARLGSIMARALVEAASLGFSPEQMEASFSLRLARWREEVAPASRAAHPGPGPGLVAMGSHDLALDLLASHLRRISSLA